MIKWIMKPLFIFIADNDNNKDPGGVVALEIGDPGPRCRVDCPNVDCGDRTCSGDTNYTCSGGVRCGGLVCIDGQFLCSDATCWGGFYGDCAGTQQH